LHAARCPAPAETRICLLGRQAKKGGGGSKKELARSFIRIRSNKYHFTAFAQSNTQPKQSKKKKPTEKTKNKLNPWLLGRKLGGKHHFNIYALRISAGLGYTNLHQAQNDLVDFRRTLG